MSHGKKVLLPFIDADACVGCTLCQHVCPVTPRKAVEITPL
jgi:Pyruvate/2-oxoacid:ferredoxin oxidoreductase delta subunit